MLRAAFQRVDPRGGRAHPAAHELDHVVRGTRRPEGTRQPDAERVPRVERGARLIHAPREDVLEEHVHLAVTERSVVLVGEERLRRPVVAAARVSQFRVSQTGACVERGMVEEQRAQIRAVNLTELVRLRATTSRSLCRASSSASLAARRRLSLWPGSRPPSSRTWSETRRSVRRASRASTRSLRAGWRSCVTLSRAARAPPSSRRQADSGA